MKVCHHCRGEVRLESDLKRTDSCAHCFSDLKCCLNCRFHDRGANNQCREPAAEWCSEKTKSNFCEFFEFREVATAGAAGDPYDKGQAARAAFESLFGDKKT